MKDDGKGSSGDDGMDVEEDLGPDNNSSEASSDSDDSQHSDDGRPQDDNECFFCEKGSDSLVSFGTFMSCKGCMQLEMLKSDKARESIKLHTGNSANRDAANKDDDGDASVYSNDSEGDDLVEAADDAIESHEDSDADLPRDSLGSTDSSLSTRPLTSPKEAFENLFHKLIGRPHRFDADTVFQEPITYSKYEPFPEESSVQPLDAKRWMYYKTQLVLFYSLAKLCL